MLVKYGLVALSSLLWLSGLADQFDSLVAAGKYLGISALMVVLAVI